MWLDRFCAQSVMGYINVTEHPGAPARLNVNPKQVYVMARKGTLRIMAGKSTNDFCTKLCIPCIISWSNPLKCSNMISKWLIWEMYLTELVFKIVY